MANTHLFLALTEGVLHFRFPKFGLKNTSATKRCFDTTLHKFRSGWDTIISFFIIVISSEYFARQHWYLPPH